MDCHLCLAYFYVFFFFLASSLHVILIPLGIFSLLVALTGACSFLFLKYQSRAKYWFQAPPNIPEQIKEVSEQMRKQAPRQGSGAQEQTLRFKMVSLDAGQGGTHL